MTPNGCAACQTASTEYDQVRSDVEAEYGSVYESAFYNHAHHALMKAKDAEIEALRAALDSARLSLHLSAGGWAGVPDDRDHPGASALRKYCQDAAERAWRALEGGSR